MKGKILGVAAGSAVGVITGEDGNRYRYTESNWKGAREAAVGLQVDFDAADGAAFDVYPALAEGVLGGLGGNLDGLTATPAAGRIKQLLTETLAFPLALLVLLAFYLPAFETPRAQFSSSVYGVGKPIALAAKQFETSEISDGLKQIDDQIAQVRATM